MKAADIKFEEIEGFERFEAYRVVESGKEIGITISIFSWDDFAVGFENTRHLSFVPSADSKLRPYESMDFYGTDFDEQNEMIEKDDPLDEMLQELAKEIEKQSEQDD